MPCRALVQHEADPVCDSHVSFGSWLVLATVVFLVLVTDQVEHGADRVGVVDHGPLSYTEAVPSEPPYIEKRKGVGKDFVSTWSSFTSGVRRSGRTDDDDP